MLNREQIMEIIPHRDPFLLIDEVVEMESGKRVVALKHVREDEYYFKGHFPGNPVVPGVILVESLAQAGAVCALSLDKNRGKTAYFAGLNKAKFRKKVTPGMTLRLEVEIIRSLSKIGIGSATAYGTVQGQLSEHAEYSDRLRCYRLPGNSSRIWISF